MTSSPFLKRESADARFKAGDEVIVHSFGLGAEHDGGYAEFGRFPADWVIPLPKGLTLFEASALGVAGHTAALAIDLMESNGLTPANGKVLVNGATGGVASIAIDILAQRGYQVVAMSGKADQASYLKELGAQEIIGRNDIKDSGRPLETPLWAGAVDSVAARRCPGSRAACRKMAQSRHSATQAAPSSPATCCRSSCAACGCLA